MLMLVFNFQSFELSPLFNQFSSGPTDFQQTTFLQFQFKFSTGSMVFNWFVGSFNRLNRFSTGCVGSFNRFSTGRQTGFQLVAIGWQWSFHAEMAILPRARSEGRNRQGAGLGNRLRTHGCSLGLGARGGDGGVEEERDVEHLALQQQPGSLLHLMGKGNIITNFFHKKFKIFNTGKLCN